MKKPALLRRLSRKHERTNSVSSIYQAMQSFARPNLRNQTPEDVARAFLRDKIAKAALNGPFAEYVELTPALARVLLENNPNNRRINSDSVAEWAKALRRGEWQTNGEPIIVANTGELNDGQHRCQAVAETKTPITVLMSFGTSRSSRDTIDLGLKRTPAAVFTMEGIANATVLSAAIRFVLNLQAGKAVSTHRSIAELKAAVLKTPELSASISKGLKVGSTFRVSGALMTALHYLMALKDRKAADEFMSVLASGIGLNSEKHPIFILRARLLRNLADKAKLPNQEIAGLIIKAWNSVRADKRQIGSLRLGANEPFPRVR